MKILISLACLKLINTHSGSFCLNLDTNLIFFYNYRVLHNTFSRPYVKPPRPDFRRDLSLGTTALQHSGKYLYHIP